MTTPSIHDLNIALCAALGITDTSRVTEVTLVLKPQQAPRVLVQQMVPTAAGQQLADVLRSFELKPAGASDAA